MCVENCVELANPRFMTKSESGRVSAISQRQLSLNVKRLLFINLHGTLYDYVRVCVLSNRES